MDIRKVRHRRGRLAGFVIARPVEEAERLVRNGEAEWVDEERATARAVETPRKPRRSSRSSKKGKA